MLDLDNFEDLVYERLTGLDDLEDLIYEKLIRMNKLHVCISLLVKVLKEVVHNSLVFLEKMRDELTRHFGDSWVPR